MSKDNLRDNENKDKILLVNNYSRGFPTDRITCIESIVNNCIAEVEFDTIHFTQNS